MVNNHQVIESLRELADESMQLRLWLASCGPEVSSFTEAICQLFDDTGLGDDVEKRIQVFSPEIDEGLSHLRRLLPTIDQRLPPLAIIKSREMQAVRYAAAEILQKIDAAS